MREERKDGRRRTAVLAFRALRVKVGDETWFETMRPYHQRYKYRNADTADFVEVVEEVSGCSITVAPTRQDTQVWPSSFRTGIWASSRSQTPVSRMTC
jgi:hypothetical protein